MKTLTKVEEFLDLADEVEFIVRSKIDWETKYGLIFSDEISARIWESPFNLNHCDPDNSCREDVCAYASAVEEKATELREGFNITKKAVE